jgi:hypothetical protein
MKKLLAAAVVVLCVGVVVGLGLWKPVPSQPVHHFEAVLAHNTDGVGRGLG